MKHLNKFRLYVIIVFTAFVVFLLLILSYTALKNETIAVFDNLKYSEKSIIIDAGHGALR